MADSKQLITIKVRLFTGIEQDAGLNNYDRQAGLDLNVPGGPGLIK